MINIGMRTFGVPIGNGAFICSPAVVQNRSTTQVTKNIRTKLREYFEYFIIEAIFSLGFGIILCNIFLLCSGILLKK